MVTALLIATALLFAAQTGAQKGGPVGPPGTRQNRECYCWTKWLDRDNPSGKGDYERVQDFRRQSRPPVCAKPVHVFCQIKNSGACYPYGSGETIVSILLLIRSTFDAFSHTSEKFVSYILQLTSTPVTP